MILKCDFKSSKVIQLVFVFILLMSNFVVSEVYAECQRSVVAEATIYSPKDLRNLTVPVTISLTAIKSFLGQDIHCNRYSWASYNWESSDGQSASGKEVALTYHKAGIYQIKLKIKNDLGSDTTSISVNIPEANNICKSTSPAVIGNAVIENTISPSNIRFGNLNGSTDEGLKKCKSNPHSYGLFTQADIDKAKSTVITTDKCKTNPRSCGLFTQVDINKAKSTIKTTDKCKANPRSCGLYTQSDIDKAKSTAVTTDKCKTNPRSCGLFTQVDIDKAKSTVITSDKCKTNPRSCGLFTQVDIDKAKSTVITSDKCIPITFQDADLTPLITSFQMTLSCILKSFGYKTNPRSCGLFTQVDIDKAKSTVITSDKCKTNPHSCGLFSQADIDAANAKNTTADKCKTNPYSCGLFAKTDIDKAISEGLAKGKQNCVFQPESCGIDVKSTGDNQSSPNVTLSNNLEMRIPLLTWNQFLNEEEKQLWADLIYIPSGDNRILFEVIDYGFH